MGLVDIITKVTNKLRPPHAPRKPEQDFYEIDICGAQVRIPEGRYQISIAIKMIPRWSRNQIMITGNAFGRIARELQLQPERLPGSMVGVPGSGARPADGFAGRVVKKRPRLVSKYSAADIIQILKRAEERNLIKDPPAVKIPEYLPVDGAHDNLHGVEIFLPGAYYTPAEACNLLSRVSKQKLLLTSAGFGRAVTSLGLKDPSHHGHDEIVAYTRTDAVNKHEITCYRYSARAVMEVFFHADQIGLLKSYEDEIMKIKSKTKKQHKGP